MKKNYEIVKDLKNHIIQVTFKPKKDFTLGEKLVEHCQNTKFCKVRAYDQKAGIIQISGSVGVLNDVEKFVKQYFAK